MIASLRRRLLAALALSAATFCVTAAGPAAAPAPAAAATPAAIVAAGACDRACLTGLVDQYLEALVAHDAARLPLRKDARFTENGQTLRMNDGLWGTAEGLGDYKLYFADPLAGQVGFFGTVRESGRLALLALRLKVEGRKITEIESVVARTAGTGPSRFADLKDQPLFHEKLAPADRRSRQELAAVANSYFEGLEQATGKVTPFFPDCTRIENGSVTANNPAAPNAMGKLSCGAQFDTGFSPFITEVRGRRYPVIDEDYGLVLALVAFDHSGRIKTVKETDGTILHVPAPFDAPYSFMIAELFKVKGGRIARVEAVLLTTPYAMPSGW
ncbi:MAG TPA: hypothetical protein VLW26_06625 [Steroidobacteraceae bacterium]|nr:hypothetical protein [Steroidobacteraceae bacterium]